MNSWEAEARRLIRERLAAEPERAAALWAEVEAEAWQEVRALVKAAMVEVLLETLGDIGRHGDRGTRGQGDTGTGGHGEGGTRGRGDTPAGGQVVAGGSRSQGPSSQLTASGQLSSIESQLPEFPCQSSAIADQPSAIRNQPLSVVGQLSAIRNESSATGIYVYGIIDRTDSADLPAAGVAEGHPVKLQPYRDVAAVVSEVPLDEWGQEALEAHLADMTWLEARVRAHEAALDAVLPLATLAPMKFATIYLSPDGVREFLATHYDEFVVLLGHLAGRQEWGLKLYCDDAVLAAHIADISPEVAELRAEIASKPKGVAYLLARKLQETSDRESERIEMEVADRVHTGLAGLSVAVVMHPLQSPEVSGRAERMLLNAAYLVDDEAVEAFQAALAEIAAGHDSRGFQFDLSGPWPAYNFATLRSALPEHTDD